MAGNLADVMDQVGVALGTITGLRVFDFPPLSAQPPFAFVNMPETIEYDLTFGRGFDRMTLQVFVGVANQVDRTGRDAMCAYAASTGALSIKSAIEAGVVGATVRVTQVEFATIALASNSYAGLSFTLDIVA